jgi:hypothetical protein
MSTSEHTTNTPDSFALWSDDPSAVDLLSFNAVAETAADALLDDRLDPIALGLSGSWGSGKTTVLNLVASCLAARGGDQGTILVVKTDPWRYDPLTGAKESLIAEVLDRLGVEVSKSATVGDKAKKLLKRLVGRINWSKAIRLAAKTSLALQIPTIDELTDLVKDSDASGSDDVVRGMERFRDEFAELMASDELKHLRRVVVLVDDLDRCLPETVIDSLEAIRLFLAVPKMSFVLAADEDRVAEAIRTRFPESGRGETAEGGGAEEAARLYLHKIVQTTIRLPALSRFDTQAFLLLLQLQQRLSPEQMVSLVDQCQVLRLSAGDLDDLPGLDGVDLTEELAFADRLTPLLYEKLRGSPRRVKRFLNDLHVRQAVASRRGIELNPAVVAKLMVLEVLLPEDFNQVLEWLAQGVLRDQIASLELVARSPRPEPGTSETSETKGKVKADDASQKEKESDFSDGLIRWAKLPPALSAEDLAGYLYLAAAFKGRPLLDTGLPGRLQDLAARLQSSSRREQKSVSDDDLASLSGGDAQLLIQHLGRIARDRPADQRKAAAGILRIVAKRPSTLEDARKALLSIPPDEVSPATPMLFKLPADAGLKDVLEYWRDNASREPAKNAAKEALRESRA